MARSVCVLKFMNPCNIINADNVISLLFINRNIDCSMKGLHALNVCNVYINVISCNDKYLSPLNDSPRGNTKHLKYCKALALERLK